MDDFKDLLPHDAVFHDLGAGSKKALFQSVAGLAAKLYGLDQRLVGERLTEREKLGSTGFGAGVAIPHGKIEGLDRVVGLFAKLAQPLEFAAIDGLPVDLVFILLSPPDAGVDHLKALARVSRRLRDRGFVDKLRGAGSADALYALFAGSESRDAA
jgi:PTS system nitrogen regulatory IIA component